MKHLIWFAVLIFLSGCAPQKYIMKGTPDIVTIIFPDGTNYNGELISVADSDLVFNLKAIDTAKGKAFLIPINKIASIQVNGYSDETWYMDVLFFQFIPAIVMAITASSINPKNFAGGVVVFSLPALFNSFLYLVTTRTIGFNHEQLLADPSVLAPYAFYPGGIPEEKLNQLLKNNDQLTISNYPKE